MSQKEPILVIMAAGMGSRYGGLKQMDPVGAHGELIIDYSLFDARRAGFKRVCFIIKHEIEADFKAMIGNRIEKYFEVSYAFQQLDCLPEGFSVPEGRVKPFGTAHAVLCAAPYLDAPFAAINADDYYGPSAFDTIYRFLKNSEETTPAHYAMVGYLLKNTVTENGHVARGICVTDESNHLISVTERTHIITTCDGPLFTEDGTHYERLCEDTIVSMNLWGFTQSFVDALRAGFPAFLEKGLVENPLKCEYFLPSAVTAQLQSGAADVTVLSSPDKWYGVTYRADKPVVVQALAAKAEEGLYPAPLWA